jgi:RecA-family ATPase
LANREPAAREWFVDGVIPRRANVLLGAHGGAGKTNLLLFLAVCVALGLSFFGIKTTRAVVVAVLAEDDVNEIHRRLAAICAALGVAIADLAGWLYLYDAVGCDVALFGRRTEYDVDGRPIYTAEPEATIGYAWLKDRVETIQAELLLLVSVSDLYDAEENRRPHVRRYLNLTLDLVLSRAGTVVHSAHVDKAVARGNGANGQNYSGSTAWNNSVRSRLALTTPNQGDGEEDGRRVLTVEKLNYGRPGLEIPLRWDAERHVFVREGEPAGGGIVGSIRNGTERRAVLRAIDALASDGRMVATARQANQNAAAVLTPLPDFPASLKSHAGRRRLFDLLHQMEADGAIAREYVKTPSRKHVERWIVTPTGRAEVAKG